jgi:hypothetical protein
MPISIGRADPSDDPLSLQHAIHTESVSQDVSWHSRLAIPRFQYVVASISSWSIDRVMNHNALLSELPLLTIIDTRQCIAHTIGTSGSMCANSATICRRTVASSSRRRSAHRDRISARCCANTSGYRITNSFKPSMPSVMTWCGVSANRLAVCAVSSTCRYTEFVFGIVMTEMRKYCHNVQMSRCKLL